MFDKKQGLYILKEHVERFERNGTNPWIMFSLDYEFIKEYFGELAAEWAKERKHQEMINFFSRLNVLPKIDEITKTQDSDLPDKELEKIDSVIVEKILGKKKIVSEPIEPNL